MQTKTKYFLLFLSILLIGLTVWYLKTIVFYIIASIILSLIGQPFVRWYSKIKITNFRIPSSICALLALFTLLTILMLFFSLFIPLIVEELRIVSKINPNDVITAFKEPLSKLEFSLQKFQIDTGNSGSIGNTIATQLSSILGFNEVSVYAQQIVGFMGSIVAAIFSISFITFFLMKDERMVYNIVILLTPTEQSEKVKEIMNDMKVMLSRYFIGVLLDMAFVATLTGIGLTVLGLKNALLIGLFAGILNVIPYVGPLLGFGFAILIGVSGNLNLEFYTQMIPLIEKIALVFLIVQLIDAFIFQPLVISSRVKAHPLEIFLVILIAAKLGGILGMVLAIPLYTILRIIAKEFFNNFKFIQKLTEDLEKATEEHTPVK